MKQGAQIIKNTLTKKLDSPSLSSILMRKPPVPPQKPQNDLAKYHHDYYQSKLIDTVLLPVWTKRYEGNPKAKLLLNNTIIHLDMNAYELLYLSFFLEDFLKEYQFDVDDDLMIKTCARAVISFLRGEKVSSNENEIFKMAITILEKGNNSIISPKVNKKMWELFRDTNEVLVEEDIQQKLENIYRPSCTYTKEESDIAQDEFDLTLKNGLFEDSLCLENVSDVEPANPPSPMSSAVPTSLFADDFDTKHLVI